MKIGFIGAGKMGFTLGKHLMDNQKVLQSSMFSELQVSGYYSLNQASAKEAAEFTDTKYYENVRDIVMESDIIFLTVPDGQIAVTAMMLDGLGSLMDQKIICHTSGALSSLVFSGMTRPVFGYSIHPIYAVNSKTESYKHFSDSFITIEGSLNEIMNDPENSKTKEHQHMHTFYINAFEDLFLKLGHRVRSISAEEKPAYHMACVFASNLVVGVYQLAAELLTTCGFSMEESQKALVPLFLNNAGNIAEFGTNKALTGPVARGDIETVKKHLAVFEQKQEFDSLTEIAYRVLSQKICEIGCDNMKASIEEKDSQDGTLAQKKEQMISEISEKYEELRRLLKL